MMLKDVVFVACGGGGLNIGGEDAALILTALICFPLGGITAICNAGLLFAMGFNGVRGVGWHVLGWFAYVGAGILTVIRSLFFSSLTLAALAIMALTIIIAVHLLSMIAILRRCPSNPERYCAVVRPCVGP